MRDPVWIAAEALAAIGGGLDLAVLGRGVGLVAHCDAVAVAPQRPAEFRGSACVRPAFDHHLEHVATLQSHERDAIAHLVTQTRDARPTQLCDPVATQKEGFG